MRLPLLLLALAALVAPPTLRAQTPAAIGAPRRIASAAPIELPAPPTDVAARWARRSPSSDIDLGRAWEDPEGRGLIVVGALVGSVVGGLVGLNRASRASADGYLELDRVLWGVVGGGVLGGIGGAILFVATEGEDDAPRSLGRHLTGR